MDFWCLTLVDRYVVVVSVAQTRVCEDFVGRTVRGTAHIFIRSRGRAKALFGPAPPVDSRSCNGAALATVSIVEELFPEADDTDQY